MVGLGRRALVLGVLLLAPALDQAMAQPGGAPRRPRGLYAVVDVEFIDNLVKAKPSITRGELHAYFTNLYKKLLGNQALSGGLAIQVGWERLNPNPISAAQPYDWSYLDDAFASVSAWNAANPRQAPKTIMVSVFPGFFSPPWVLDQILSCDGLFQSPRQPPPSDCGKATFRGYVEPHDDHSILPLPWNPIYKRSFRAFLRAFAARFGSRAAFVSMDVGGPTAASTEIQLPTNGLIPNQIQFGGITPNEMWLRLLAFFYPTGAYRTSWQAIIDEWNAAIDMFGEVFHGVTLVVWQGGLPDLSNKGFSVPPGFKSYCLPVPDMYCASVTTILSHLADPRVGGSNGKAFSIANLNGDERMPDDFGSWKRLAQSTAPLTSPSAQVLGGQQLGTGFSTGGIAFGCASVFPPDASHRPAGCTIPSTCKAAACIPVACIPQACLAAGVTLADLAPFVTFGKVPRKDLMPPEQGLYNMLRKYFGRTPVAAFFGGTPDTAPENFLQAYSSDFTYAAAHVGAPAKVVKADGSIMSVAAQDLLNLASEKLVEISEPATFQGTSSFISDCLVLGSIDKAEVAKSLSRMIQAAKHATGAARIRILDSFKNEVNAQAGKHITGIAPAVLLRSAHALSGSASLGR